MVWLETFSVPSYPYNIVTHATDLQYVWFFYGNFTLYFPVKFCTLPKIYGFSSSGSTCKKWIKPRPTQRARTRQVHHTTSHSSTWLFPVCQLHRGQEFCSSTLSLLWFIWNRRKRFEGKSPTFCCVIKPSWISFKVKRTPTLSVVIHVFNVRN